MNTNGCSSSILRQAEDDSLTVISINTIAKDPLLKQFGYYH
jgi:hypothetical protein